MNSTATFFLKFSFCLFLQLKLCSLVSLQRYKKALSGMQRASLVEQSRQKPPERIRVVTDVNYSTQWIFFPFHLSYCGFTSCLNLLGCEKLSLWWRSTPSFLWHFNWTAAYSSWWTGPRRAKGTYSLFTNHNWYLCCVVLHRILTMILIYIQLKAGNGEDLFPRNGRWNFNNKVCLCFVVLLYFFDLS